MVILNTTLNPNDATTSGHTLTNGNLTDTMFNNSAALIRATNGKTQGKWYWEVKVDGGSGIIIGVMASERLVSTTGVTGSTGSDLRGFNGSIIYPENTSVSGGVTFSTGAIIGVALDLYEGTLKFIRNGNTTITHTNLKNINTSKFLPFFRAQNTASKTFTVNFGASPFTYSIPQGYEAYNNEIDKKILFKKQNDIFSLNYQLDSVKKSAVPKMTSNTSPEGEASASSSYSNSYSPYLVFNGLTTGNPWFAPNNREWIQYKFVKKTVINSYAIIAESSNLNYLPKSWEFQGSDDNINFETLHIVNNQTGWTSLEKREFNFKNNKPYLYYRLNLVEDNGSGYRINGLEMYEKSNNVITILNEISKENFINSGLILDMKLYENYDIVSYKSIKNNENINVVNLKYKPKSLNLK